MPSRPNRTAAFLLTLLLGLPLAQAQADRTPQQLIDSLGVEIRQILETPKPVRAPEDAERAVAAQITALARRSPGDDALVAPDAQGRTPLMLAVSGAYPLVVKALLADPIVRGQINTPDLAGETAWMVASFAPAMTLVACQPAALTLERRPLLTPYLRRMTALMQARSSVVVGIVQALEDAGAEVNPDAARKAWLARCPNAAPELRKSLAGGDLQRALVNDALDRQLSFNKAYAADLMAIPQRPPQDMRFNPATLKPVKAKDLNCPRMRPPAPLGALNWTGSILFRAVIATRAGVVEAVDFTLLSASDPPPAVVNHFRGMLVRTLAGYHCEGDHVFEQEFHFKVD
jgi:Ankyrin repeat